MNRRTVLFLLSVFLLSAPLTAQSSDCITFTFDSPGALPSAAGFQYVGTIPESDAFTIESGKLHLHTLGTRAVAYYSLPNAYDPARDFELELEAHVLAVTGPFGFDFEVSDDTLDFEFGFMESGVYLPPPGRPFAPLATAAGQTHVYRITHAAGTFAYQLSVDGAVAVNGTIAPGGDPAIRFAFGDGTADADSDVEIDNLRFCQPARALTVSIDVKPGSFPNSIQRRSNGRVPVAILGSGTFSVRAVNPATVTFAGAPAASPSVEDVNADGIDDLVLHFATQALQLGDGDTAATLSGFLYDGTPFSGRDSVRLIASR
jgi:hypothetical protein